MNKTTNQPNNAIMEKFEKDFPSFLASKLFECYEEIKKEKNFNYTKETVLTDAINKLTWNIETKGTAKEALETYTKALNELQNLAHRLVNAQGIELIALELKYSK